MATLLIKKNSIFYHECSTNRSNPSNHYTFDCLLLLQTSGFGNKKEIIETPDPICTLNHPNYKRLSPALCTKTTRQTKQYLTATTGS